MNLDISQEQEAFRKKNTYVESYGSVEGVLSSASCQGEGVFVVNDAITHKDIVCKLEGELVERAKAALGRRVVVDGRVLTSETGGSKRVWGRRLYVRPLREELPPLEFFRGIAPDMTGGLPSEVYVKKRFYGDCCKP